jgi:hypothetical protein
VSVFGDPAALLSCAKMKAAGRPVAPLHAVLPGQEKAPQPHGRDANSNVLNIKLIIQALRKYVYIMRMESIA